MQVPQTQDSGSGWRAQVSGEPFVPGPLPRTSLAPPGAGYCPGPPGVFKHP